MKCFNIKRYNILIIEECSSARLNYCEIIDIVLNNTQMKYLIIYTESLVYYIYVYIYISVADLGGGGGGGGGQWGQWGQLPPPPPFCSQ